MENTMKTRTKYARRHYRDEVAESLAHYLVLRKAYTNEDEALIDCYTNSSEVIDTLIYLDAVGEPNAQSFYYSYVAFLGSED